MPGMLELPVTHGAPRCLQNSLPARKEKQRVAARAFVGLETTPRSLGFGLGLARRLTRLEAVGPAAVMFRVHRAIVFSTVTHHIGTARDGDRPDILEP